MPDWTAELVVDERLARRLLAQFPELEIESLRPFAEGWDYTIWLVNERWTFRFPRREIAVPGVRREIAVLPELAPLLPIPVPVPVLVGEPVEGFPWPFFGSELLPGRELGEKALDDPARVEIGGSLARFLRRLHDAEVAYELPADGNRRADMSARVPKTREQLGELEATGLWQRPASVDRLLEAAEGLPPSEAFAVVHGDLHFRQVLVGDGSGPTGVIDWVDVCRSDPAIDLSMLWSYLPPEGREVFLSEYGAVSDEQLMRARVVGLSLSAALAHYGHHEGFRAVEREALSGLARAAAE
ncbi:MAG: aminoglycoside phosphotransferase [Actinobacteria bacterium]|nr:MAG: aminoglycoside phosphotransferase [Actinomycetota bacterium]